jgi:hypothetical protein
MTYLLLIKGRGAEKGAGRGATRHSHRPPLHGVGTGKAPCTDGPDRDTSLEAARHAVLGGGVSL